MFSKGDLKRLEQKAQTFVSECNPRFRAIDVFYRNKPLDYFKYIERFDEGIMSPLLKDNNGDPKCPTNGKLSGLFFMGKTVMTTADGLPDASPFGERRVKVPAYWLFHDGVNLYFSDFWCHKMNHYVSLIITKPDSRADRFCQKHLPELDKYTNKYLRCWNGQVKMLHGYTFWIEIFYTESIKLRSPDVRFSTVAIIGRGHTTPGGIKKNTDCDKCNIIAERPMQDYTDFYGYGRTQSSSVQYRRPASGIRSEHVHNRTVTPQDTFRTDGNNDSILYTAACWVGRTIASAWNWVTGN